MTKLEKIVSIIESCETYDQVKSCFSFIKYPVFCGEDFSMKYEVLSTIMTKAYSLRNADIKEHRDFMKQIGYDEK